MVKEKIKLLNRINLNIMAHKFDIKTRVNINIDYYVF